MDITEALNSALAALPAPEAPAAPDNTAPLADAAGDDTALDHYAIPDVTAVTPTTDTETASETTDEPVADVTDAPVAIPEGYAAPTVLTDGLVTEFTLSDGDGEIEVPALTVTYKANGKVRADRLDQVVKLAQVGVYNQEREDRVKSVESAVQERDTLRATLAEREAQLERALTDPEFLEQLMEAYAQETSPEAEVKRAKEEVTSLRVQQEMEKITSVGQQFYDTELTPAFDMIAKAYPLVTVDELEEQFTMAMAAHTEEAPNGQPYVPVSRYAAVRQYIVDNLAPWAQHHHSRRVTPATPSAPPKVAPPVPDPALVDAQRAKREVGQITKPVGTVGASSASAKSAPAPSTVDDAIASALDHVLASVR